MKNTILSVYVIQQFAYSIKIMNIKYSYLNGIETRKKKKKRKEFEPRTSSNMITNNHLKQKENIKMK